MKRFYSGGAAAALVIVFTVAGARDSATLSETNFVDVGDSVSEMLDTSGLAFSTMLMDTAALQSPMRNASFDMPGATRSPSSEAFKKKCPGGGTLEVDVIDADGSGDVSAHDRFKLIFGACMIGGDVVSGRSEFVVAAHRFEGANEITELDFRFNSLGSRDTRWTGAAHAVLRSDLQRGTESYLVTYRDLAVTRGPHSMHWNFSIDMVRPPVGNQVASVKGDMTVDGMRLELRQDEPFIIAMNGNPNSGQVTASDKRGARLQIEAHERRYAYRFFAAGNAGERADSASQSKAYGGG